MRKLAFIFMMMISASAETFNKEDIGKCWDKYNKMINLESDRAKMAGLDKVEAMKFRDVDAYLDAVHMEELADNKIKELNAIKEEYKNDEVGFCKAMGERK
jgi:hypothetical protein